MQATLLEQAHEARTMQSSSDIQSAWTKYWKMGNTDSMPKARAAGALSALDTAWKNFFEWLPEGARILDLATGGGDVIRAALLCKRDFSITGVDIADLSAATPPDANVSLVGNTDLSQLPFPDASFEAVVSQFGIEYADIPAAVREAVRVLAPGGRGHFVVHHKGGPLREGLTNNLAAYRLVFSDDLVFQAGRDLFRLRQEQAGPREIAQAKKKFHAAVSSLEARLQPDPHFAAVRNIVRTLSGMAMAPSFPLRQLEGLEEQIHYSPLRMTAQINAALDREGIDRLAACLRDAGVVIDAPSQELTFPTGRVMAWSLSFHRSSRDETASQ
jgi:ubiquinone/menaquinone biosynthesis C-methylase UbiE